MLDEAARNRTFDHAMEIWFEPEIRRRQQEGSTPQPFPFRAAQVIIYPDDRPHEIRLNEEVEAVGHMKLKDGVTKSEGDPVYLHELEEMPSVHLPETADPNCGHFTLLLLGDRWYGSFDFRYNKGKASELLAAAEEFFQTASTALDAGRLRAAIDNLFSAAELAAKAYVISTPLPGDCESKSHGLVHSRFNMLSRHGNIESEQRKAFNALASARARARYVQGNLAETRESIAKWQSDVAGLISHVRARTA
jgi:uncharacterized protein (UPF0332 family)